MQQDDHVAIVGAGVIGASWAALFLASGRRVAVHDPASGAEAAVRDYVAAAWPVLEGLGLTARGDPGALSFHATPPPPSRAPASCRRACPSGWRSSTPSSPRSSPRSARMRWSPPRPRA